MKLLHCNTFIILLSSFPIFCSPEDAPKGPIGSARKLGQCWKSLHGKKPNSNSSSSSSRELVKSGIGNNFPDDSSFNISDVSEQDLPPSFDYRTQAVVGRVKEDQKSEAPYASAVFASIAALEASYMLLLMKGAEEGKLAPGQLVHFSEQDTVNCLLKFGYREAAQEATYSSGFERIVLGELYGSGSKKLVGIRLESDAPPYNLNQFNSQLCDHSNSSQEVAQVVQVIEQSPVEDKPEESALSTLKKVLFKYGPVIVGYKMADNYYIRYLDGEQHNACTALDDGELLKGQNHLMLAVGWTPKYLIMKNSWGTDWGIEGYLYLNVTHLENCGVTGKGSKILFPVVREI